MSSPSCQLPSALALVAAQHADRLEPELRVRADRALVVGGGVDREAMVAALLDQVGDDEPQRLGAEPLPLVRGGEADVERGVLVLVGLLVDEQQPGELAPDLDHVDVLLVLLDQVTPHPRLVPLVPPARDRGLGQQRVQRRGVVLTHRAERDSGAVEDGIRGHAGSMADVQQGGWRRPAEIAPDLALTLRTCGVMPAEGAMRTQTEAPVVEPRAVQSEDAGVTLAGVAKRFGAVEALSGVSLRARPGETLAVVGPSGCGKSTLLELVCGLQAPDAGTIDAPPAALMPQHDGLLPWLSALDNAGLALRVAGRSKAEARAAAHEHFAAFGLEGFEGTRPAELSGGMRQRVAFLRTLLAGRPLLCLDEPFGALDALTRAQLQRWLAGALVREPRTVLLVTHDVEEAVLLADRIVLLSPRPGRVVAELSVELPRPRERTDPKVVELRERALRALGVD